MRTALLVFEPIEHERLPRSSVLAGYCGATGNLPFLNRAGKSVHGLPATCTGDRARHRIQASWSTLSGTRPAFGPVNRTKMMLRVLLPISMMMFLMWLSCIQPADEPRSS